ncbi:peptidase inhibitor family I36 protein [Streptomyces sp. NPDC059385]
MNIKRTAAAALAVAGLSLGMATPASAAGCQNGYVCLYYNSNLGGSYFQFDWPISNLGGYYFTSAGAGQGQYVKNNAASAYNKFTTKYANVYYNSNFAGPNDYVPPYQWINLVETYNNNASVSIF